MTHTSRFASIALALVMFGLSPVLTGVASANEEARKTAATLTLIAEPGVHMSTRLQYSDGSVEHIEFLSQLGTPVGPGELAFISYQRPVQDYVMFTLDDARLRAARDASVRLYSDRQYRLNNSNCIQFASTLAREAGFPLKDAFEVGKTARQVVSLFAQKYQGEAIHNVRPFPWLGRSDRPSAAVPLSVTLESVQCGKTESVLGPDRLYVRAYADGRLVYETPDRKSLNDGQTWTINQQLATVSAGTTFAVQVLDDDAVDADDLVFDESFVVDAAGSKQFKQERGVALLASRSRYAVNLNITESTPSR